MSFRSLAGQHLDAFENGEKPVPAGEYRLLIGRMRSLRDYGKAVIEGIISANGDGTETEHKGRVIELWLNFTSSKSAAIAGQRCRQLGLSVDDLDGAGTDGRLPKVVLVRAIATEIEGKDGIVRNELGKIIEVLQTESQATRSDTLEAY